MSSVNTNSKLNFDSIKPFDGIAEWAAASGCSSYMLRDLCMKGEIPYIKSGSKFLICKQGFIEYLEKKMQENTSHD